MHNNMRHKFGQNVKQIQQKKSFIDSYIYIYIAFISHICNMFLRRGKILVSLPPVFCLILDPPKVHRRESPKNTEN